MTGGPTVAKKRESTDFTVEVDGQENKCRRVVDGTKVLTQTVVVEGVGSEADTAKNGLKHGHRVESMEGMAKQIARELILKAKPARPKP